MTSSSSSKWQQPPPLLSNPNVPVPKLDNFYPRYKNVAGTAAAMSTMPSRGGASYPSKAQTRIDNTIDAAALARKIAGCANRIAARTARTGAEAKGNFSSTGAASSSQTAMVTGSTASRVKDIVNSTYLSDPRYTRTALVGSSVNGHRCGRPNARETGASLQKSIDTQVSISTDSMKAQQKGVFGQQIRPGNVMMSPPRKPIPTNLGVTPPHSGNKRVERILQEAVTNGRSNTNFGGVASTPGATTSALNRIFLAYRAVGVALVRALRA